MGQLDSRVALVTGASRGIGRAIAQRLAAEGATVVVSARSLDTAASSERSGARETAPGTLAETVALIQGAGGRAIAIAADLEQPAERASLVDRTVTEAGRLDVLVNNAGFADYARVDAMSLETFDRTIEHYLRTPFVLAQAAIPRMREQGRGWIVNIGSVTALSPVRPYLDYAKAGGDVVYASVKAALARFTQGLAAELIDDDIAVNLVAPSTAIRTPGASALIPEDFPTEDVAYLVETVVAMCERPAAERTGVIAFSMHYPHHHRRPVMSLDGRTRLPDLPPPAFSHPAIGTTDG